MSRQKEMSRHEAIAKREAEQERPYREKAMTAMQVFRRVLDERGGWVRTSDCNLESNRYEDVYHHRATDQRITVEARDSRSHYARLWQPDRIKVDAGSIDVARRGRFGPTTWWRQLTIQKVTGDRVHALMDKLDVVVGEFASWLDERDRQDREAKRQRAEAYRWLEGLSTPKGVYVDVKTGVVEVSVNCRSRAHLARVLHLLDCAEREQER